MRKLKIGIVGGTTPQSTVEYYNYLINTYIKRYNDHAYPEIIIYSVSFQNYINWMNQGKWQFIEDDIVDKMLKMNEIGADFAIIATNTLHKVFPGIKRRVPITILSIIECVAKEMKKKGIETVGLLGTRYTMEDGFYSQELENYGIKCLIPGKEEISTIHEVIFNELSVGEINPASKEKFAGIIHNLKEKGAQGVVLGCTEIPLLISQDDVDIPVFDTTKIHAEAALDFSIRERN